MNYKTPGVYIKDVSAPRSNVPELETAVPAFIGFTEKALDNTGASLHLVPTRIRDLGEFNAFFGNAFSPEVYQIFLHTQQDNAVARVIAQDRYYLYDSLQHYFDNGGGECYIVSIGTYADGIYPASAVEPAPLDPCAPPSSTTPNASASSSVAMPAWMSFQEGMDALTNFDEPTLLLFPDAVRLLRATDGQPDTDGLGQIQQHALRHCAHMQDRFALLDLIPADRLTEEVEAFRQAVGTENLSYGAAYHPWIYTVYTHSFRFRELTFWDAAFGHPISSLAELSGSAEHQALVEAASMANQETDQWQHATGMALSGATQAIRTLRDSIRMAKAEAAAEPVGGAGELAAYRALLDQMRTLATAFESVDQLLSGPFQEVLEDALSAYNLPNSIQQLYSLEQSPRGQIRYGADTATQEQQYGLLEGTRWLGNQQLADISPADYTTDDALWAELESLAANVGGAIAQLSQQALALEGIAEEALFAQHPVLASVAAAVQLEMQRIPPSGAVAGIIVTTDAERGVWKAPANVSLQANLGPERNIDPQQQESLNVHESGKAINAIRNLPGRGAVVWGARTLLANSLEWRYVPVRRLFMYVEEYLKKATEAFVFEPNDANTWLRIRNQTDAFLRALWRQGALYGNTTSEAYFINIGLGQSMITQDILEGRLIVEIGLAAVRPAEFIIVRYECRMEE